MAMLTGIQVWVYQATNGQYSFFGTQPPKPPGVFIGFAKITLTPLDANGKEILPPLVPPIINVNQGVLPV